MEEDLSFLEEFPKDDRGLYIVYELYTFDNFFRLLLKSGFDHESSLSFILCNCSLSALVFQERIHDGNYKQLSMEDALPPRIAACKAKFIYELISIT